LGQSPLVMHGGASTTITKESIRALDPVLVQVHSALDQRVPAAVFILNTGETPLHRLYPLRWLGLPAPLYAQRWPAEAANAMEAVDDRPAERLDELRASLRPHEGQLWLLTEQAEQPGQPDHG
jgi:hypothetical protein